MAQRVRPILLLSPKPISVLTRSPLPPQISFLVSGQVQGVGFRYFTRKRATSHEITGWVRNTSDEKVSGLGRSVGRHHCNKSTSMHDRKSYIYIYTSIPTYLCIKVPPTHATKSIPCSLAQHLQVQGEAQGSSDHISKFVTELNKGPSHSSVRDVETSNIEVVDGETGFQVKR